LADFVYIGNDIIDTNPPINIFYNCSDEEMVEKDLPPINCIALMGIGGYEISQEPSESSTVSRSLKKMVEKYSPKLVIQECIQEYEPLIQNFKGYREIKRVKFEIPTTPDLQRVFKRVISVEVLED
jgi:hypothetical protein